jgi:hypothetical protein
MGVQAAARLWPQAFLKQSRKYSHGKKNILVYFKNVGGVLLIRLEGELRETIWT